MAHSSGFQPTTLALDTLLSQSATGMHTSASKCCCGRPNCAYLEHNDAALRGLEHDLQSAAQIGQALLTRHEAYIAKAEEERRAMSGTIDRLEEEKSELEHGNAKTIEENRYLLDQLEELNSSFSDADSQIISLNTTLQSTMLELDRLTSLAAQTSQLEKQLESLEAEQHVLQQEIISKECNEKSAVQRWKNAERMVNVLQEQVERIEKEANEERTRHAEVVSRFERRRLVEKELENAAGRLKGAAAAKGMGAEDGNHSVVSSFVKDILQDNANLQLGIVELRDLLMGSNEEVENLRDQMILHQPMLPDVDEDAHAETQKPLSLDNELARTPTAEILSDFHVHHHYHAAPKDETKRTALRRPKKRRNITSPGLRTPNSGTSTPQTPSPNPVNIPTTSSAAAILAQTSVTIPPTPQVSHTHNWSMSQAPSSAAFSSIPSSPIFDTMSDVPDSSRPTTPGSTHFGSPQFLPRHTKRGSDVSDLNLSLGQIVPQSISSILHTEPQDDFIETYFPMLDHNTIPEEPEDDSMTSRPSTNEITEDCKTTQSTRPTLHRASSHESLLSARGLDIPKIRSIPSTHPLSSLRTSLGTSISSGVAITGATAATAHRSKGPPRGFDSRSSYNNLLSASAMSTSPPPGTLNKNSLGNRVGSLGGWIAGRWGIVPTSAASNAERIMTSPTISIFSKTSAVESKESNKDTLSPTSSSTTTSFPQKPKTKTTATPKSTAPTTTTDSSKKKASVNHRLSTHLEPLHLDNTLLQESLSEELVVAENSVAGNKPQVEALEIRGTEKGKGKMEEKKRLSTHVEAVTVDGAELAKALASG